MSSVSSATRFPPRRRDAATFVGLGRAGRARWLSPELSPRLGDEHLAVARRDVHGGERGGVEPRARLGLEHLSLEQTQSPFPRLATPRLLGVVVGREDFVGGAFGPRRGAARIFARARRPCPPPTRRGLERARGPRRSSSPRTGLHRQTRPSSGDREGGSANASSEERRKGVLSSFESFVESFGARSIASRSEGGAGAPVSRGARRI